ncbi:MAG: lasso peptide isopeptide bond-forming cyclase [Cyanobacteria bacterium P01_G01_bin.67]
MSGIIGIYHPRGKLVDPNDLSLMLDSIAHRGSDSADCWYQEQVGLGHRMCWTTPESLAEKLPQTDSASGLTITADARIDNRQELITKLNLNYLPPEKITDSAIILAAYQLWEHNCSQYLIGDFAFAIWDQRQQQLFCARDHFGVKPFYYFASDSAFVFASEIKGILTLSEMPQELNEDKIADYMIGDFDDLERTFYSDISRLPPAHSLIVDAEGASLSCYWSLEPRLELESRSDEDYALEFQRLFTEAVRCRLRAAFPVGSELSGGLDSSSVACVARNLLKEAGEPELLHTFSAIFERIPECDESEYINQVLAQGGFKSHYLHGDRRTPLTDIEQIFWHEDEAFFAPGFAIMRWGLCQLARDRGVKILLNGHDGDSTVSHGFGYLHELAQAGRWLSLYREAKGVAKIYQESVWKVFWSYFYVYGIRKPLNQFRILKLLSRVPQKLLKIIQPNRSTANSVLRFSDSFNQHFVQQTNLKERHRQWLKAEFGAKTSSQGEHYRLLTQGLHQLALEIDDKAASAFGIEIRYPFWDKRLVEFCFSLPPEQKLAQGWSRVVMRRGMAGILPPEVQWRTSKMDFSPNFQHGLLVAEKPQLEQLLFEQSDILKKYINLDVLRDKFLAGKDIQFIWRSISLGLWLHFLEQNISEQNLSSEVTEHQTMTLKMN